MVEAVKWKLHLNSGDGERGWSWDYDKYEEFYVNYSERSRWGEVTRVVTFYDDGSKESSKHHTPNLEQCKLLEKTFGDKHGD